MANTKKPTVRQGATIVRAPSSAKATADKKAILDVGLRVELSDPTEVYEVRYGDVTPRLARDLRASTGMGWQQLIEALRVPDVDLMQAFIFLARRVKGEQVTIDDVDFGWSDMARIDEDGSYELTGPAEAGTGPEA